MTHDEPISGASRVVAAPRAEVYRAFLEPEILLEWLPPAEMMGTIHAFDGRIGGGYEMSLLYPDSERTFRGKTADREDRVHVRFVELTPPERIVEAIRFISDDPVFEGEMTLTVTFAEEGAGTHVTMAFAHLPEGLRPEDNDEGARISLAQLAQRLEPSGERRP